MGQEADINVVPLIDVLLVLLVTLLVSLPVLTQQLSIRVPKTAQGKAAQAVRLPLRVQIDATGQVVWPDGENFADPSRPVLVEADAKAPYESVARVVAKASGAGMSSVRLVTQR
jgi:biopolymer transport protein ExbD